MLLDFKNVGDIFSLDDYNAIIYLLTRYDVLTEEVLLTREGFEGDYASYLLSYDEELSLSSEHYVVVDNSSELLFIINTNFTGEFKLSLNVSDDFIFNNGDVVDSEDLNYRVVDFYANVYPGRQEIVIPLNTFENGTYISTTGKITVSYNQPIINKYGGSIYDDTEQHLIKTPNELLSKIETAPSNTETTIRLTPGTTYSLFNTDDDQDELNNPIIIDNKTIILESGSLPSTLDAGGLHRQFYITETGKLIIRNIELTNGNANDDTTDTGKGGSVFVKSARVNNVKLQGNIQADNCKFTNNTASIGGAIYNEDGIVNITNTIFYNNESKSKNNIYGDGGAIFNEGAS